MKSKLFEMLNCEYEPVAVFFTDERPDNALQFKEGKRGCVASMLIAAASKGKAAVFDEKTYGCPGGGVGICFGDTFSANNHPTERLLSTGFLDLPPEKRSMPAHVHYGERFYASPELVKKWKSDMPYVNSGRKYVVFKPFSVVAEEEKPDLIFMFVNPDQLSAMVITAGYNRGTAVNITAPFAAACQSILFAYQEIQKESPKAVLGFFDISQRSQIPKEYLSLTFPYAMLLEMEQGVGEGCMTTEVWKNIAGR
ncbi:MAG: DUF169 domain-containing protein [Bacillota bacterium]|jgi:uncharacterized protein (DUF169 family)